jgi:CubicO group peptidase (beta-lactamase class C family)
MSGMRQCLFFLAAAPLFAQINADPAALESLREALARRGTQALLISLNGQTVLEYYAPGRTPNQKHYTASLAKAIAGGLSLQLALQDRKLTPSTPAAQFIPSWRADPLRSRITVAHLAAHTSGLDDAEQDNIPHRQLPGWKGEFWRRKPKSPVEIALTQTPVVFEPGSRYAYSNPGMAALAFVVSSALEYRISAALAQRIFRPVGIPDAEWQISYGESWSVQDIDAQTVHGGGSFTPRAVLKIGQLLATNYGAPILNPAATKRSTRYAGLPKPPQSEETPNPASALAWYTNEDDVWPSVPRDAFLGAGAGHQLLLVVPSLRLAAVRMGANLDPSTNDETYWRHVRDHFLHPLFASIRRAEIPAPYPPSKIFSGVQFAPESQIRRAAPGSDNFPITWLRDDSQLTAYGDGWGFEPLIKTKLSLGFARLDGTLENFTAQNIRTPSGERSGDGAKGLKASGLVSVKGVLYMWARNAANAQLAWSEDNGRTWHWGFTLTESFASPSFLNAGRDYAENKDGYVYAISQDNDSAYQPAGSLVLARAPLSKIRDRNAWQFYSGAAWSKNLSDRKPVFQFPGHCERTDLVYHPPSRRYLLALSYNHEGAWGLFDGPNPWGPWTTVFHTSRWDQAATHGYRLPAKWINGDRLTLVYSGIDSPGYQNDFFCTRTLTLLRRP